MWGAKGASAADIAAMLRLSHSLHTCDATTRKKHLLSGFCQLVGAGSGMHLVAHVDPARRRYTIVSTTRHGSARTSEQQIVSRSLIKLEKERGGYRASTLAETHWHPICWPAHGSARRQLDHCLWCFAPTCDARVMACVSLSRAADDHRPFAAHHRHLLHLAHMEMSWVYESDLLLISRGASCLSPRQRQILQHLLAGHSEKETAKRLRMSTNTVHHHVKALYRHFGVSTRSELLARWLR